jgi:hypothetical protein
MREIQLRPYYTEKPLTMFIATDDTYRHMGLCMRISLANQQYEEYHRGQSCWLEYYDDKMERVG